MRPLDCFFVQETGERDVDHVMSRAVVGSRSVAVVACPHSRIVAKPVKDGRNIGVAKLVPHTVSFLADPTNLPVRCDLHYIPN
jgi:hypothetical protein